MHDDNNLNNTALAQMALPANTPPLEHPSPSLVEVGSQRVELCLADDGDLDADGLEGDAFDLGFDLVRLPKDHALRRYAQRPAQDLHGPDAGLELGLEGAAALTQPHHHELDATVQAAF